MSETDDSDLLDAGAGGTDFDFEVREIVSEGVKASSAIENLVLEVTRARALSLFLLLT